MEFQFSAGIDQGGSRAGRIRFRKAAACLALALGGLPAVSGAASEALKAGQPWASSISGRLDVRLNALDTQVASPAATAALGRNGLVKRYHGELDAQAEGEMLTASGLVKGSAAYVAVERVVGTLGGRSGSFALVHRGVMQRGQPEALLITVVPDSGTGELAGLSGELRIERKDGQHHYRFDYTLP